MSKTGKSFFALALTLAFFLAMAPGSAFAGCVGLNTTFYFGDIVDESCTFDGPMVGETGHGLIIGAPGITIDGNGYCLDGVDPGACGYPRRAGILNDDYDDVTIKNLEIKNFCNGIHLDGTSGDAPDGNIIECCRIHDNGNTAVSELGGILLGKVNETKVTGCEIYNNKGVSVALPPGGFGIYHFVGEYCEFTNNYIHDNMATGIFIRGMPYGNKIKYNAVEDNGCIGIAMMCMNTGGTECEYNYCNHNGGCGIVVNGSLMHAEGNTVRYNVVKNTYEADPALCNQAQGILFYPGYGIILASSAHSTTDVSFNTSCDNADEDIANPNLKTFNYACNTCDNSVHPEYCVYACGEEPDANFFAVQKFPESGDLRVKFTDLSTPGSDPEASLDSWYWDFGDCSDPVTVQNPYHTYAAPGNYMVCLSVTDNEACGGGEGRRDTMCQKIAVVGETAGHFILNYSAYPFETREQDNYSGAAVMRMLIDHYRNDPWVPTQEYLQTTGIAYNQSCNSGISYVDPQGMRWTLNDELHDSTHGKYANYGIGSYDDVDDALHYICYWQYAGPGAAPTAPAGQAYSDYSQWMAVRGIHTSEDPTLGQGEYDLFGFWINDPNIGGIGENTYKTDTEWLTYYKPLGNLETDDVYEGKYVAVCEPPDQPAAEVNLTPSPARLAEPVNPVIVEEPVELEGLNKMAALGRLATVDRVLIKKLDEEDSLKMVRAAIDGVTEELIPYDPQFAAIFAKTVPGAPMLVNDGGGNYYLVPFNLPIKSRPVPIGPVHLAKAENKRPIVVEPVPIEPIELNKNNTLVVVRINGEDGSFNETSWVEDPVKYLPVSMKEALKLVLAETGPSNTRPVIELVNIDSSPYYPAWKITVDRTVYLFSQDGTVSYDNPVRPIKEPIPMIY